MPNIMGIDLRKARSTIFIQIPSHGERVELDVAFAQGNHRRPIGGAPFRN
jgi:hypothetical protein